MNRVKTGIPGFDKLVEGGFPRSYNILIAGAPGTGKTIFGLQYLVNGAKDGEPGLYISLDAEDGTVRKQGEQFGWQVEKLESQGKLMILDVPLDKSKINIFDMIEDAVNEIKAKRIVFDSLPSFAINIDQFAIPLSVRQELQLFVTNKKVAKEKEYRYDVIAGLDSDSKGRAFYSGTSQKRITYLVINELSRLNTTNVVITGGLSGSGGELTIDGVSEYVCDGLLHLDLIDVGGGPSRMLKILKMRETKNSLDFHNFEIKSNGIAISSSSNKS
jgi:KaiC/GvpD/RAD55 family RecA-like ATPase